MDALLALSDEDLCSRCGQGDHLAEEALILRYRRLVRMCCRPLFLAGGDSEDLLQEGMIGLLTAVRMYDSGKGASFRTYAEVCIRSRLLSAVKAASRGKNAPLNHSFSLDDPLFYEHTFGSDQKHSEDPEAIMIGREEFRERVESLRGCLSEFEAGVLSCYLKGLSYGEIAREMGRSVKSVDNAVQRIRKKTARHYQLGDISES